MARADKWMEPFGSAINPVTKAPIFGDPGTLIAGASAVSGLLGAGSASDAASQSAKGTAASNAMLQQGISTNNSKFSPYENTGSLANARLAYLLGLTPLNNGSAGSSTPVVDKGAAGGRDFLYQAAKNSNKLGAYYQLLASGQLDSSNPSSKSDKLRLIYNSQNPSNQSNAPLDTSDGQYGSLLKNFSMSDLANDPVYQNGLQFGLDEGTKAIDRLAAARGGTDSGATLKSLVRYANDYGTTKTQQAYNNFNNNKQTTYGFLSGQQGVGLNATGTNQGLNAQLLTGQASNIYNNGQAQGQYGIQGANALNNSIQGGIGNYLYNQRTQNAPVVSGSTYGSGGSSSLPPWYLS